MWQPLYEVVMSELNRGRAQRADGREVKRLEPEPMDKGDALLKELMETALSVRSATYWLLQHIRC